MAITHTQPDIAVAVVAPCTVLLGVEQEAHAELAGRSRYSVLQ